MFYSFFFIGALGTEVSLFLVSFVVGVAPENSFIYLMAMTAAATVLFLTEGTLLLRKLKKGSPNNKKVNVGKEGDEVN
jgi:hypothetical protein